MGSAGHAFLAHTKALSPPASVGDGGWGLPPHPLQVRPGQRFWPRAGSRKRPFAIKRVSDEAIVAQRLDGDQRPVRLTPARLLATRDDGQGRHYAFSGFVERRYATHVVVVALDGAAEDDDARGDRGATRDPGGAARLADDARATLIVPEWHPARPVVLPARQLPVGSLRVGAWFAARADLGATSAPRLALAGFVAVEDPGPERAHRPAWRPDGDAGPARAVRVPDAMPVGAPRVPAAGAADAPPHGRGCGDIVVALSAAEAAQWAESATGPTRRVVVSVQRPPVVHQTGPTPKLTPGARLYLAREDGLLGWTSVTGQRPLPNGDVFLVSSELEPAEPVEPFDSFHNWRWRWWSR